VEETEVPQKKTNDMLQHKNFMTQCCILQWAGIKFKTLSMIDIDYNG